jgi:hypothetical protein
MGVLVANQDLPCGSVSSFSQKNILAFQPLNSPQKQLWKSSVMPALESTNKESLGVFVCAGERGERSDAHPRACFKLPPSVSPHRHGVHSHVRQEA